MIVVVGVMICVILLLFFRGVGEVCIIGEYECIWYGIIGYL